MLVIILSKLANLPFCRICSSLILLSKGISFTGIFPEKKVRLTGNLSCRDLDIDGLLSRKDLAKLSLVLLNAFKNFSKLSAKNANIGKTAG